MPITDTDNLRRAATHIHVYTQNQLVELLRDAADTIEKLEGTNKPDTIEKLALFILGYYHNYLSDIVILDNFLERLNSQIHIENDEVRYSQGGNDEPDNH